MSEQNGNVFESLKRVSENLNRIYQSGFSRGVAQSVGVEREALWNSIMSEKNWQYKFCGSSWNDRTFYPICDLKTGNYANHAFYLCQISDLVGRLKECGVILDVSGATERCDAMFNYCTKLTTVPYLDVRNCNWSNGVLTNMFTQCTALKTIEGIHLAADGSQTLGSSVFSGCKALEDVTFYGAIGSSLSFSACVKLSRDSICNIIEHLGDTAEGKNLTLSQTAVNAAFTDTEWAKIIAAKPNWTFNLA